MRDVHEILRNQDLVMNSFLLIKDRVDPEELSYQDSFPEKTT